MSFLTIYGSICGRDQGITRSHTNLQFLQDGTYMVQFGKLYFKIHSCISIFMRRQKKAFYFAIEVLNDDD